MTIKLIIPPLVGLLVAFGSVRWIYFKILRIAFDKKLVDNPNARKLQQRPIPVSGGLAVYFGLLSGLLAGVAVSNICGTSFSLELFPVVCSMSILLFIGALDDILVLTPSKRLIAEILTILGLVFSSGICIDTFMGMWTIGDFSWWVAVPLTLFAGVGIVNAINMIDGVNGLSSGLCISCCIIFGCLFVAVGDWANAVLAFTCAGALAPFFIHNVFGLKSRMFIGDAGTMAMGILMLWFTMSVVNSASSDVYLRFEGVNFIAFCLAALSVPVFDTLRVMIMRMLNGRSPFKPDKTHLHHIFVRFGFSHFVTAMSEVLIMLVIVAIWIVSVFIGTPIDCQLYTVILSSVALVWGTYFFLDYHEKHQTVLLKRIAAVSIRTHLGRTEWWQHITAWLDAPSRKAYSTPVISGADVKIYRLDEHLAEIDEASQIEVDRKKVLEYLRERNEVTLDELRKNCTDNITHLYQILDEEDFKGFIRIVKKQSSGLPEVVSMTTEHK